MATQAILVSAPRKLFLPFHWQISLFVLLIYAFFYFTSLALEGIKS